MNPAAQVSLADYASQRCLELKTGCEKVEKERNSEKRGLVQRVGLVACKILNYADWGSLACFALGALVSRTFFVVGTVFLAAFAVGKIAGIWFKIFNPTEARLIETFKKSPFITLKDDLPAANELKAFRSGMKWIPGFINDVAKVKKEEIDQITIKDNLCAYTFINFFGGKGLAEKMHAKQPLTPDESARKEQVLAKMREVKVIYATSHLLEGIQNVAKGKFAEAKKNAEFIQARKDAEFPAELRQKVELLAAKMAEPNKALQDKVKQAVGKKFKLSDLDSVYAAVA